MTNQQKIEFYLSKGFAVEVEWDDKEKAKIYHIDSNGNMLAVDNKGMANIFESCFFASIKSITPILPNPYEFSVGERVIIVKTGKTFEVYTRVGLDGKYGDGFGNSYYWYQLAPALPDDKLPRKAIEAAKRCIDDPSENNKREAWPEAWAVATARAWGLEAKIIEKGLEILKK